MTKREELLFELYQQSSDKGYTDMQDDVQSLKVKVIATDLGLKYKNIADLYNESKTVYENECKRREEETRHSAIPGTKFVEIFCAGRDKLSASVYRRQDGSCYWIDNSGQKIEGLPTVTLKSSRVLLYQDHAPQTIYTGATVGRITTGGIHQTEAYATETVHTTDSCYLALVLSAEKSGVISNFKLTEATAEAFKRDDFFKQHAKDNTIVCYLSGKGDWLRETNALTGRTRMTGLTLAMTAECLPMNEQKANLNFLNRVFSSDYPPTDAEYYEQALALSKSNDVEMVSKAIEIFTLVEDYKDAKKQRENAQKKSSDLIQRQKEQAILEKERRQAEFEKKKPKLIACGIAISVLVIGGLIFKGCYNNIIVPARMHKADYEQACTLMESGSYAEASEIFDDLAENFDYRDSAEKAEECHNGEKYTEACALLEERGHLWEAVPMLQELSDSGYEGSQARIDKALEDTYNEACANLSFDSYSNIDSDDLCFLAECGYQDSSAKLDTYNLYACLHDCLEEKVHLRDVDVGYIRSRLTDGPMSRFSTS